MIYLKKLIIILSCFFLFSCISNGPPPDVLKLSHTSLQDRQLQSRKFKTTDEIALLTAGVNVLQDMGYNIEETEKNIGLITCMKNTDATDTGQIVGAIVFAALTGVAVPIDKEQKIRVSFVTIPSRNEPDLYIARITFQRIIWDNTNNISSAETIKKPEIYEEFFEKLSKSVFLEAHKI